MYDPILECDPIIVNPVVKIGPHLAHIPISPL